jgi:polysaccharide pyruvyl transferase WcaK-like protein
MDYYRYLNLKAPSNFLINGKFCFDTYTSFWTHTQYIAIFNFIKLRDDPIYLYSLSLKLFSRVLTQKYFFLFHNTYVHLFFKMFN